MSGPAMPPPIFILRIDGECLRCDSPTPTAREVLALAGCTPEDAALELSRGPGLTWRTVQPGERLRLRALQGARFRTRRVGR